MFYLLKSGAYAWVEPASLAVDVLENAVPEVNEAAITPTSPSRILITYFPQCAASVFGLNLIRAPFFLGGINAVLTGQNLRVLAVFRGPPGFGSQHREF